jgi:hypothetical protein
MSAIRPRASPRPNLLVFDITAKIAKADVEKMAEAVDAAFDQFDKIDMLLILSDFEGMDIDAAFDREALAAQVRSIRHVRKYGVVGAPAWARAMIEISGVVSPVESKTFELEQEAEAWAWIQEG